MGDLRERGVAFRSPTEHMDTTTPQGELPFAVFGALAQHEHALIRERVMAGLEAGATRGRQGGRPRAIPLAVHAPRPHNDHMRSQRRGARS